MFATPSRRMTGRWWSCRRKRPPTWWFIPTSRSLLRPLFAANPQVDAVFESPDKFDPAVKADVVVLDRFTPPSAPRTASIWIQPPAAGSPISVQTTETGLSWTSGILRLRSAQGCARAT